MDEEDVERAKDLGSTKANGLQDGLADHCDAYELRLGGRLVRELVQRLWPGLVDHRLGKIWKGLVRS